MNTMGIVCVIFFAIGATSPPIARITSGLVSMIGGEIGQPFGPSFRVAIGEGEVAPLAMAELGERAKHHRRLRVGGGAAVEEDAELRARGRLRARRERPCRRAAQKADEPAPPHPMTPLATARDRSAAA